MTLRQIADQLGLGAYPEGIEAVFQAQKGSGAPACDLQLIDQLQEMHGIFGDYYTDVRQTASLINDDPVRSAWVRAASAFAVEASHDDTYKIPAPEPDGTLVTDYLMLHILIPQMPGAMENYRRRGFSEEEIRAVNNHYKGCIYTVKVLTGRPGINRTYYRWLVHFTKATIFHTKGLQFELKKLPPNALWLRNRETKQVVPLLLRGTFHPSGVQPVGSAGYETADDSFTVTFEETEQAYVGHGVFDGVVSPEPQVFDKALWECVGNPGDGCLNVHIPRGADISPATFREAWDSARQIVRQRFPEHGGGNIFAYSWLFDPALKKFLKEDSAIIKFQNMFARFPIRSDGKAVFNFVFRRTTDALETLPEDTSLQRKIKALYLDGKYIYEYAGAIFEE